MSRLSGSGSGRGVVAPGWRRCPDRTVHSAHPVPTRAPRCFRRAAADGPRLLSARASMWRSVAIFVASGGILSAYGWRASACRHSGSPPAASWRTRSCSTSMASRAFWVSMVDGTPHDGTGRADCAVSRPGANSLPRNRSTSRRRPTNGVPITTRTTLSATVHSGTAGKSDLETAIVSNVADLRCVDNVSVLPMAVLSGAARCRACNLRAAQEKLTRNG